MGTQEKGDYAARSLLLHEKMRGKFEIRSKVPVKTKDDLSLAYTPGVAEACLRIKENPDDAYKYTAKGNLVAVVTDGSAVLGLGDIGSLAGMPVMEGKAILFKELGGVDAIPICLNTRDTHEIVDAVHAIAPTFGGINLEDIKAPECFEVEERLKELLDIPVFHDDQHGTAVVVYAALTNALKVVKKELKSARIVISGAGAAGLAIAKLLIVGGAKKIIITDSRGILPPTCVDSNKYKCALAEQTNPEGVTGGLAEAVKGADVFIGVSKPGILTREMVTTMGKDAIILAMANPVPEIMPDEALAAGATVIGTGRSDFPNQINNVLAFPGIFRGALDVRASDINEAMKLAAAEALAALVPEPSAERIIPDPLDKQVAPAVAKAVAEAAVQSGVARKH